MRLLVKETFGNMSHSHIRDHEDVKPNIHGTGIYFLMSASAKSSPFLTRPLTASTIDLLSRDSTISRVLASFQTPKDEETERKREALAPSKKEEGRKLSSFI